MQNTTRILTAAAIALVTGSAIAQTQNAPLRGPTVRDAGKPDSAQPTEAADQKKIELPFASYALAVRALQRSEDEALRLTPEQAELVRAISQQHREAMREYLDEHKEEIAQLREISGEREPGQREGRPGQRPREDGARPDGAERREQVRERVQERREQNRDTMHPEDGDRPQYTPEERAKAAQRLRELLTAAPADKLSKEKLQAVLTKEQQARVEVAIEAQRQRIREGRPLAPEGREGRSERQPGGPEGRGERQPGGPEGERPARRPARD